MKFFTNITSGKIASRSTLLLLPLTLVTGLTPKPAAAQTLVESSFQVLTGGPSGSSLRIPSMLAPINISVVFPKSPHRVVPPAPLNGHPGDPPLAPGGTLRYANDGTTTVTSPYNSQGIANWVKVKSWTVSVPVGTMTQARVNLDAASARNMTYEVVIASPNGTALWTWQTGYYTTSWGLVQAGPLWAGLVQGDMITLYFKPMNSLQVTQMTNTTFEIYW